MAGTVTKAVKFLLLGESKSAEAAFDKAGKGAQGLVKKLKGVDKSGMSLKGVMAGVGMGVAGAVAAGGAALLKFGGDSVGTFKRVAGETAGLKRVMGGSAEDASRMGFALKMSGVDAATGTKSFTILGKNLAKAAQDGKQTEAMAKMLGTSFTDATGKVKPMSELMPKIAEKFASMPDGAEKTALAMKLFGKSGTSMIPFLNKGAAGLAEMSKKSDELGNTLSGKQLDALKKSKTAQREWDAAMQGLQVTVGSQLLPILTQGAEFLNSTMVPAFQGIMEWVQKNEATFQALGNMVRWVWNNALLPLIKFAVSGFIAMNKPLAQAVQALGALTGNKDMEAFGAGLVQAADDTQRFVDGLQGIPDEVAPEINVKAEQAKAEAKLIKDKMALLKDKIIQAKAKGDHKQVDKLQGKMDKLKSKLVNAEAKAKGGGAVDGLKDKISKVKGKSVTVTATIKSAGSASWGIKVGTARISMNALARGGILMPRRAKRFAAGGVEDHRPHIYGPGDGIRIFNEPETHGEAYIPFNPDRRGRALAIWRETGKRLGVSGFARGGISGGTSGGGGAMNVQVDVKVAPGTDPLAVGRAIRKELLTLKRGLGPGAQLGLA